MNSLKYHKEPSPGKIEVVPKKRCTTQDDLSLAYSPGVAEPCREICRDPFLVHQYTNRSNLVAVISNGTAVLGLGKIGPMASKPVMEGKAVLFKRFADIDVFDLEIDTEDPDIFIQTVSVLEPTFGGINLEDIKAPECFYIEKKLKEKMSIPVFHDDQHGTAIISGAALINALEITGKDIHSVRIVVNGAGAAGIACSDFYTDLGVNKGNIILCDSRGIVHKNRDNGMNPYKEKYAVDTGMRTLEEAIKGADIFLGLSIGGVLTEKMLLTMNNNPIIFALANPDPEISPEVAMRARRDIIIATGRSDYPNQVNNVLGFPFIFRGALDVQASHVTDEMKIAAANALAGLAKMEVPGYINRIYNTTKLEYGKEYLIPKPFDSRVFFEVSTAVAEAAVASGVARGEYPGRDEYRKILQRRYETSMSRFLKE